MKKFADGPWRQGMLLLTSRTRYYTKQLFAKEDAREKTNVYAFFRAEDQGKSREHICTVTDPANIPIIVAAPDMYKALKNNLLLLEMYKNFREVSGLSYDNAMLQAAIVDTQFLIDKIDNP